jgi:acyl-coenzyme A synthetase/AMP-(fatty) acid ligase
VRCALERNARTRPDDIFAAFEGGERWTFAQSPQQVASLAGNLHELGVRQGDHVVLVLLISAGVAGDVRHQLSRHDGECGAGVMQDVLERRPFQGRIDRHIDRAVGEVGQLILRTEAPWAMNHGYNNNPGFTRDAFIRDANGDYWPDKISHYRSASPDSRSTASQ